MNYYSLFYWLSVGDKLSTLFAWSCFFSTFLFLIFNAHTIFTKDSLRGDSWFLSVKKLSYFTWVWMPLSWLLYIGTPTKKEALLIIGGGAIGNFITQDSSAQKLPSDVINFLRVQIQQATHETIKELSSTKKVEDMTKEELLEYIKNQK